MDEKPFKSLLEKTVNELLNEFGQGNPIPGSGTAAAFHGLVSAQLIQTFIHLTCKEKYRPEYDEWIPEFQRIKSEIENRVYPELKKLFNEDSEQFKKYITLCKQNGKEDGEAMKQLATVTEIPLTIAKLCCELAHFAAYVSKYGFKPAKGDAAVALNSSIASIASCLSIVDLNLSEFGCTDWTIKVRQDAVELRNAYKKLHEGSLKFMEDLRRRRAKNH